MSAKPSVAARVSTGLKDPIEVLPIDLESPVSVVVSEHVKEQWHHRVLPHRTRRDALIVLVERLESGEGVRTRRSPYRWVRASRSNSLYLALGRDIIFPAEPLRGSRETVEVTTCMTNPVSRNPLAQSRRQEGRSRPEGRKGR